MSESTATPRADGSAYTDADYKWLNNARFRVTEFMRDLLNSDSKLKNLMIKGQNPFQLLVACAFSLWRAAFLCTRASDWKSNMKNADDLLHTLLEDNAFLYPQEKRTKSWTAGYYLNNARLRIGVAADMLEVTLPSFPPNPVVEPQARWEIAIKCLYLLWKELKKRSANPMGRVSRPA